MACAIVKNNLRPLVHQCTRITCSQGLSQHGASTPCSWHNLCQTHASSQTQCLMRQMLSTAGIVISWWICRSWTDKESSLCLRVESGDDSKLGESCDSECQLEQHSVQSCTAYISWGLRRSAWDVLLLGFHICCSPAAQQLLLYPHKRTASLVHLLCTFLQACC